MSFVLSKTLPDLTKLERLDGNNYKRWSHKLLMFFEQLEIDYVLFNDPLFPVTEYATVEKTPSVLAVAKSNEEAVKKFDKDNKTARCHLLNNMNDTLFDLFMVHKSARTIWESLEKKYGADDAGKKKMFPPSWSEYRNHLKHKKKDLSLQEPVGHMRTEEANHLKDKPISQSVTSIVATVGGVKASLVESGGPSNVEKFKGKGKVKGVQSKAGHKTYQCPQKKTTEANIAVTDDVIAAVVVEANLVGNVAEWVLDTGASRHLYADKGLFAEFEEVADGECVYMGNSTSALIIGKGKIFLKLTSGKTLALTNVLFVPSLRRNLVSGALLNKAGLKLVFEADKVVMSRNGEFVGKGYLFGGLFILNTDSVFNNIASTSAYMAESIDV
ncbi:hypothetical protein RND81_11G140500 [Saponaria officinalis]|uniref:Retrovirus-related Pol polyprotein from transposon TNT 1-94-like beta-barrel domain-containing protein n=1 Tax=Saponaria officinalis TaxID=3572 RepID=A0AAW1HKY1_SAPOF